MPKPARTVGSRSLEENWILCGGGQVGAPPTPEAPLKPVLELPSDLHTCNTVSAETRCPLAAVSDSCGPEGHPSPALKVSQKEGEKGKPKRGGNNQSSAKNESVGKYVYSCSHFPFEAYTTHTDNPCPPPVQDKPNNATII